MGLFFLLEDAYLKRHLPLKDFIFIKLKNPIQSEAFFINPLFYIGGNVFLVPSSTPVQRDNREGL